MVMVENTKEFFLKYPISSAGTEELFPTIINQHETGLHQLTCDLQLRELGIQPRPGDNNSVYGISSQGRIYNLILTRGP